RLLRGLHARWQSADYRTRRPHLLHHAFREEVRLARRPGPGRDSLLPRSPARVRVGTTVRVRQQGLEVLDVPEEAPFLFEVLPPCPFALGPKSEFALFRFGGPPRGAFDVI